MSEKKMTKTKQETSHGLGITSFVLGLIGVFISWIPVIGTPFCFIGLALGLIQKNWTQHGLSIAGVAINGVWVLVQAVWLFLMIVGMMAGA